MSSVGDNAAETLFGAADEARAGAIAHLTTARTHLDGAIERLRWAPAQLSEINNIALAHIDSAQSGFTEMRRFIHFLRGAAALDAQPSVQPVEAQAAPTFASTPTSPSGKDREGKLSNLAGQVIDAAIQARLNLDTLLELPDAAQADDAALGRVLGDVEARCAQLREALETRAEVARCEGSA